MSSSAPRSAAGIQPDQSGYSRAKLPAASVPEVTVVHLGYLHSWYLAGAHTFYQGEHSPKSEKGFTLSSSLSQRRKIVYANDLRDRMAVGADGLLRADGERLKPREVDSILRTITDGEVGATGEQFRKTRSRILKGEKELASEYIEVTTTVSAADMIIKGQFALYTGEALKREEVSSIRVNAKK